MTVTAADIRKAIEENAKCAGIDQWIAETLMPTFITKNGGDIDIDVRAVTKRWHKDNFIKAMQDRGFKIEYKADNRPAEYPYYRISL